MAAITASMVGALRAKTDAPMMECKKALTEADGDMDRAEEILRVKLGSKASKASSRIAAEGVVARAWTARSGALVELNCETDFVTKNDSFLPSPRRSPAWSPSRRRPTWRRSRRCRSASRASARRSRTCGRA
jgi:translation elongation factor Ts